MSGIPTASLDLWASMHGQEDITITDVTVFVNPYTEEDEEEDKAKEETKELSFAEQQELVSEPPLPRAAGTSEWTPPLKSSRN